MTLADAADSADKNSTPLSCFPSAMARVPNSQAKARTAKNKTNANAAWAAAGATALILAATASYQARRRRRGETGLPPDAEEALVKHVQNSIEDIERRIAHVERLAGLA